MQTLEPPAADGVKPPFVGRETMVSVSVAPGQLLGCVSIQPHLTSHTQPVCTECLLCAKLWARLRGEGSEQGVRLPAKKTRINDERGTKCLGTRSECEERVTGVWLS